MSEPLTTIEIRLARVIDDNGSMAVRITTPETFSSVEVLGLLEAAKLHVYNEMNHEGKWR